MMDHTNNPVTPAGYKMEDLPLHIFFLSGLQDIYWAENHLAEAMPEIMQAATSQELKNAISFHLDQTQVHATRLEEAFEILKEKAKGTKCKAMAGILKEVADFVDETKEGSAVRDAALILGIRKVNHYKMATYAGLLAFSHLMGHKEVSALLESTLREEEKTNATLTDLADGGINQLALDER
jgi:ferritin-like metal-binding protein YciE